MKKAAYFTKSGEQEVICRLCPHQCRLKPGRVGLCRVRQNREGELFSLNYGRGGGLAVDPIEKKPLYHFYPGTNILSVGTKGCSFHCQFCQNYTLTHGDPFLEEIDPVELASRAAAGGSIGVAYTYSEPLLWYEFVREAAEQVRLRGLKNVLVTNGFLQQDPLRELLPLVDAVNLDLKSFREDFYRKICRGRLEPVLESASAFKERCHLEITTLLVPGLNDSVPEIEELTSWIAGNLGSDTPLHLSRFFPNYRMTDLRPTPMESLYRAYDLARKKLHFVYLGNVGVPEGRDTACPQCGQEIIRRRLHFIEVEVGGLKEGACARCGRKMNIVF